MKITYYGHASIHISVKGKNLMIDPFITPNSLASAIDIDSIEADYILVTHGHQDHVADVEAIAKRTGAEIITNFEIATWFGNKGLKGRGMNHGGKIEIDGITIKYVNAIHSSVLPDGTYGGNPGGFVIWTDETCVYIAGDTALTMDMKLIPMTCPKVDLAFLPIGDTFTMGYEEAAFAAEFVNCKEIVGIHYDTFPPIVIDDKSIAQAHFEEKGLNLKLMGIGTQLSI